LATAPALEVTDLSVRRGALRVVDSVSLEVTSGSIVGLLGLNGAGKSSLLASLAGDLPSEQGTVRVMGVDHTRRRAWDRCKAGLVLVPAGRQLFTQVSVLDNLLVGGHLLKKAERARTLQEVHALFPILKDKSTQLAGTLSGGQQQMLAVGRGLMARPKVLMLDEPSEGLAPLVVEQMFTAIRRLRDENGLGILLAEQNAGVVEIIDTIMIMQGGSVTQSRPVETADAEEIAHYMFGQ
jgi:branched-chain amino acid transport system ATP-binding protein